MSKARKVICIFRLASLSLAVLLITAAVVRGQTLNATTTNHHPLCEAIANGKIQASSGAQMWCFGPQRNGPSVQVVVGPSAVVTSGTTFVTSNREAASLGEDISPAGVRADGQSETSIAAAGQYVAEAWNDSTGFFSKCPSPMSKEELTGFSFSSDGGATFRDLGGLPNNDCVNFLFEGDPSVEAYQVGGHTYFYFSSIYASTFANPAPTNNIAFTACEVISGSPATLRCSQPIIAGTSSECETMSGLIFCSFLDKDFLSLDATHGRLYVSFTEFGFVTHPNDIELASCDIGNSLGGPGPLGGTPAHPVCENGSHASVTHPPAPYFDVAPADTVNFCEREGAYPAVDPADGDVYVGHEYNWATNIFSPGCFAIPTTLEVALVKHACLTLPHASCTAPNLTTNVSITSLDGTLVPGYNRFPPNDFPRIAVSDPHGTVSIVWNDAGTNPLGDILLESFDLHTLDAVQLAPVKLNDDTGIGTLHFLPALRNADADGNLNVSWYDRRRSPESGSTDVFAALGVHPRTTSTPSSNTLVTNEASNWLADSSLIVPNFGDYTDNYVEKSISRIFAAWSDGRYNIPQPFIARQDLTKGE
jgi:hypothetical protein